VSALPPLWSLGPPPPDVHAWTRQAVELLAEHVERDEAKLAEVLACGGEDVAEVNNALRATEDAVLELDGQLDDLGKAVDELEGVVEEDRRTVMAAVGQVARAVEELRADIDELRGRRE